MQAFQQIELIVDALRIAEQDLGIAIERARRKHRRGECIKGGNYLQQIRDMFELQERAKALGASGPLLEPLMPIPFRDQLVGFTTEQRKALEWKGVTRDFPFPRSIPFHFSIAAE